MWLLCLCVRLCGCMWLCVSVWLHVIMYVSLYMCLCVILCICVREMIMCVSEIVCMIMYVSVWLYVFLVVIANHLRIWYLKQPSLTSLSVSVSQNYRIAWSVSLFKASFGCSQRTSQLGRGATPMLTHLLLGKAGYSCAVTKSHSALPTEGLICLRRPWESTKEEASISFTCTLLLH